MKTLLKLFISFVDRLNGAVGAVAAVLTIIMVLNVFVVVALRYGFSIGRIWMQELYVWTHAFVFLAASGYTLREDGHVRIDLIYGNRSPKAKAIINLVGSAFFAIPFLGFLTKWSLPLVMRSFANMERSSEAGGLPGLFILKGAILLFCVTLGLQVLALVARCLLTLFTDECYFSKNDEKIGAITDHLPLNSSGL